jgi:hypothetical protein
MLKNKADKEGLMLGSAVWVLEPGLCGTRFCQTGPGPGNFPICSQNEIGTVKSVSQV